MALNFFVTNQQQQMQGIKVALYGPSGSGKTWIIKTMPAPFIISIEAGALTLRKEAIPGLSISTLDEFKEAYAWITGSQEARQFGSFAIDSVSELAEKILEQKLLANKDGRKAYGEMQQELVPWIKGFRDLRGPNVLFTFKEEYIKDEFTMQMKWAPSMPGKQLVKDVPYWFDEVFRSHVHIDQKTGVKSHYLQCQKIDMNDAKDRSGVLDTYEPHDLSHIFAKIANN